MRKIIVGAALASGILIIFNQFKPKPEGQDSAQAVSGAAEKGLKDYYKKYFPLGVAVSTRSLKTAAQWHIY